MENLARLLVQKSIAWATVAMVLVLAAASVFFARRVQQDDDLLAFLPRENADVRVFYDVNRRFGGLETALVGIQTRDPFAPDFLRRLQAVTKRLNQTEGVAYGMSLTNIDDFIADPEKGGITTGYLIPATPPEGEAERAALREKVMSRAQVVGNLISEDGQAVLIYGFPAYGADAKVVAGRVRAVVEEGFPSEAKYWGGTPFISGYIYDVSQRDIRKLAPWASAIILLITVLAFRDAIGTALARASTGLSIVFAFGLMGALGVTANVVIGSMPVVLFALGSAFAVPILTRYYALAHEHGNEEGLVRTLVETGPTVLAGGLTSVAALLSLLVMNIAPMRTFGLFTAFGLLVGDRPGQDQDRVGRRVVPVVEGLHVLEGGGVQVGHRTDRGMAVGVLGGVGEVEQRFEGLAVGHVVVALALLLLDDVALVVQVGLVDLEVLHALGLEPQRQFQGAGVDGLEVVGPVEAGGGVRGAAGGLDRGQVLARLDAGPGALEHQVLEQVREAGASLHLVTRTDLVPEVHRHARRDRVGVDDQTQPIVESVLDQFVVQWADGGSLCCHVSLGCGRHSGQLIQPGLRHRPVSA